MDKFFSQAMWRPESLTYSDLSLFRDTRRQALGKLASVGSIGMQSRDEEVGGGLDSNFGVWCMPVHWDRSCALLETLSECLLLPMFSIIPHMSYAAVTESDNCF